jgi:enoyl-CoA hydratase/carnithine racemase
VAISADDATYALTEVKLGLAAAIISLTVHARMNPRAAALTTLGGEVFTGAQAAEYGLVTRAVPAAELDDAVATVCAQLASGVVQGLRESKRILNAELVRRIDTVGDDMAALSADLFRSAEAREAMAAFLGRNR